MSGYVWEDAKDQESGKYNISTGNGYYNEGTDDKLIPNVGITMYEVINLGRLNQDGSYNTEYDNYDYYYKVPQEYYNYNDSSKEAYTITGGKSGTSEVESSDSDSGNGNYYIYGFLPGDYVLRFDYGTKKDSQDVKYSSNENAESQQATIDTIKYNGQDYENTKFMGDLSEKSGTEIFRLNRKNNNWWNRH